MMWTMMACKQIKWIQSVHPPNWIFLYNSELYLYLPTSLVDHLGSGQGDLEWAKLCLSIHYIFTKDPRGSKNKEKEQHQSTARTPLIEQSLVCEAIHLLRASYNVPTLSRSCRTTGLHTTSGPQAIQYKHPNMWLFYLYCNHDLDERQLQPTKLLEA
jgi:hypothetical protein